MNDTEESAPAGKITQSLIILHCNMALQARVRFVSVAMAGKSVASLAIASVSVYAASVYRNSFQSILLLVKFHLLFFFFAFVVAQNFNYNAGKSCIRCTLQTSFRHIRKICALHSSALFDFLHRIV